MAVTILGVGHSVPPSRLTNEELCTHVDLTPEWIEQKTGIVTRAIALPSEQIVDYAVDAARSALDDSLISPAEIDLVVVCTYSNDYVFPALAVRVQSELGIKSAHSFDLQANCAGFVSGIVLAAERLITNAHLRKALVIGAEFNSRFVNPRDWETSMFHGDAAGAVVLGRSNNGGYISSAFASSTDNLESVRLRGGGAGYREIAGMSAPTSDWFMEMNGLATWRQAITHLPPVIRLACERAGIELENVKKFIFHQANLRLIEYLMRKMKKDMSATFTNVSDIGNTGAASVPVALSQGVAAGFLAEGDLVCIAAVGAGFTFGASVWEWGRVGR